nr:hypothetical protein [Rickettsia gravesii]
MQEDIACVDQFHHCHPVACICWVQLKILVFFYHIYGYRGQATV